MCWSASTTERAKRPSRPPKPLQKPEPLLSMAALRALCAIMLLITMTACAPKTLVVLVPDGDGTVGTIRVENPAGAATINTANHYTVLKDLQNPPSPPAFIEKTQIEKRFGPVLAIEPPQPVHFLLYFATGSNELLPESRSRFSAAAECINATGSRHISVVGHTDTVGDEESNFTLSLNRAQAVKQLLVEAGVAAGTISVTSHGESNPVVPTADNVSNAANRRVEIIVR